MVELGLRVVKLGRNSVMWEVGFFKEGEEGVKAVGGFVQIWVERESGKAPEGGLEEGVRRKLEGLMGSGEKSKL